MRIVIAEDEMLERKALQKFIDQHFSDMKVVGEAVNGREAIEVAQKKAPDIIIMDIKMPGINGLQAIEEIRVLKPSIKFILLSAYDSFEYAKQAMQFGIKDYILKPGKKEETVKSLLRVKQEIEAEKQEKSDQEQTNKFMMDRFLTLVTHHPVSREAGELKMKLFPNMISACFFAMWQHEDCDQNYITAFIQNRLNSTALLTVKDGLIIVCLIADYALQTADLIKTAKDLHIKLGSEGYIGIGSPCFELKELPTSYHNAYTACLQLKVDKNRSYGFLQQDTQDEAPSDIISEICDKIEKGTAGNTITHFKDYQPVLKFTDYETLYMNIRHIFSSRNIPFPGPSITELNTDQDWYAFLRLCAMTINEMHESRRIFSQAKSYVMSHYHQSITLEDVASSVHLTPNYFSSLFKQEAGVTFTIFLTRIRLDNAKHLLEENAYSLKEISYMVGYNNPNYFSRVFKKQFGMSPKHFQDEILKK